MKRVMKWVYKLVLCGAIGYLGYRYIGALDQWLTEHGILFYLCPYILLFVYVAIGFAFARIDRAIKFGREETKLKLIRGSLCALCGLPVVVKGIDDFIKGVHGQGYVGFAFLLFMYIGFAGMLFLIGFGNDENIFK